MLQKKQSRHIAKNNTNSQSQLISIFNKLAKTLFSQRFIRVSLLVSLTVWTFWLILTGFGEAIANLIANWKAAVTMIFGSIVAGGTSMGGGAVAFPVFTKVLHVSPQDAKVFSLAIQSIGMSAASVTIIAMGTKVEWRFIRWASFGGVFGIILGSVFLAPILPPDVIKISFTTMVSSFAVVLYVLNQTKRKPKLAISFWGNRERAVSLAAGLWGGIVSGMVGSGMDIFGFSILVLLFGMCEKISTPTSVILMAINAVAGFILHKYFIGDFVEPIYGYWLAAVPVVVVGAPMGAMICNLLKRKTIVSILIGLASVELISSFVLIPLNSTLIYSSVFVFVLFSSIYYWMYQTQTFIQKG